MDTKTACEALLTSLRDTKGGIPSSFDMERAIECVDYLLSVHKEEWIIIQGRFVKELVLKCESYKKADKRREYRLEADEAAYRFVDMIKRKLA